MIAWFLEDGGGCLRARGQRVCRRLLRNVPFCNGTTSVRSTAGEAIGTVPEYLFRRGNAPSARSGGLVRSDRGAPHQATTSWRPWLSSWIRSHNDAIDIILNNLATRKTQKCARFSPAHLRCFRHFAPTYSSWFNRVELWFQNRVLSDVDKNLSNTGRVGRQTRRLYRRGARKGLQECTDAPDMSSIWVPIRIPSNNPRNTESNGRPQRIISVLRAGPVNRCSRQRPSALEAHSGVHERAVASHRPSRPSRQIS